MKKILFFLLVFVQNSYSTEIYSINLNKNEKLEGTFSITTNNNKNETAHFLFVKNSDTKKYLIKPYIFSEDKKIKSLDVFTLDEMPEILSNHTKDNVITISSFDEKNKKLFIIDFDIVSGKNSSSVKTNYKRPDIIFSQTDNTVFVSLIDNGKKVTSEIFSNAKKSDIKNFTITDDIYKEFKKFAKNSPQAINQNEFVENGSIKSERVYLSNEKLYFTNEKNENQTQVFKFDLNDTNNTTLNNYDFNFPKSTKDQNSYIVDDNLIAMSSSKEDVILKKYDLNSNKLTSEISLTKDLNNQVDKSIVEKFLLESKKSNLQSTVVINKTKNNKLKVRLSRVNKNTYNYNYNWWWQHQFIMQQMQMQMQMQQMQQSAPRGVGFGPNQNYDNFFIGKEEKYTSVEFLIDLNFKVINNDINEETVYKYFDKDAILKEFEDNKSIKKFTSAFLNNELRYIQQDSKTKTIYINFKSIN